MGVTVTSKLSQLISSMALQKLERVHWHESRWAGSPRLRRRWRSAQRLVTACPWVTSPGLCCKLVRSACRCRTGKRYSNFRNSAAHTDVSARQHTRLKADMHTPEYGRPGE